MSTIIFNNVQLGQDADTTKNYTINNRDNGNLYISQGNSGVTTQDLVTFDTDGDATFLGNVTAENFIGNVIGDITGNITGNVFGNLIGFASNVITNANLTGDVSSVGNATTLATVNGNVGTFGSNVAIPVITVNGKGLTTAVSTVSVAIPSANITVTGGDLTLSGATGANITNATLATVNSNVGTFGSNVAIPVVTVNAKGLTTAISTVSVAIPSGSIAVTGGDLTMSGSTGANITNATLNTVNSNTGQFGDATHVSQITVNGKGLITAASNVSIPNTVQISGDATSTGGTTSANAIMTLNTVNSNTGQFGDSTHIPQFTVNGKGLVTAVSNIAITSFSYPGAGVAVSNGSAWTTSYATTGTGNILVMNTSPTITGTITGNIAGAITALSISANAVAVNMGLNNNFSLTLQATTSQVLSNPTNVTAGQSGSIVITQNATPSTLTFGTNWTAVGGSVISSVANSVSLLTYYAASTTNIQYGISIPGSYNYIPQNIQSANYTTVLSDAGCHIYHPTADATPRTFTIDSNANVAYIIGTALTFVNGYNAGNLTIGINSDTLYFSGNGATGSRTLANTSIATALKLTSTVWQISGAGLA